MRLVSRDVLSLFKHEAHTLISTKDSNDPEKITNQTRKLGLVVIRGTQVSLVSPEDGTEEIANPFLDGGEEDGEDEQEEE